MTSPRAILFEAAKTAFIEIHLTCLDIYAQTGRMCSWQETAAAIADLDDGCDQKVLVRLSDGRIVESNVDRKIGRTA